MDLDLRPLLDIGVQLLAPVLVVVGGWLAVKVSKWLNLNIDAKQRDVINLGLEKAIAYGLDKAKTAYSGLTPIQIKNQAVAIAASYAVAKIPDALAHFKITPEGLAQLVEARLGTASDVATLPPA